MATRYAHGGSLKQNGKFPFGKLRDERREIFVARASRPTRSRPFALRRDEGKIDPAAVGTGSSLRVYGGVAKALAQNFRSVVHIARFELDMLDALDKFVKKFVYGATRMLVICCQNIESCASRKIQFEFIRNWIVRRTR